MGAQLGGKGTAGRPVSHHAPTLPGGQEGKKGVWTGHGHDSGLWWDVAIMAHWNTLQSGEGNLRTALPRLPPADLGHRAKVTLATPGLAGGGHRRLGAETVDSSCRENSLHMVSAELNMGLFLQGTQHYLLKILKSLRSLFG